jgi:hypothetical protein
MAACCRGSQVSLLSILPLLLVSCPGMGEHSALSGWKMIWQGGLKRATFVHIILSPTLCVPEASNIHVSNSLHSYAVSDLVYHILHMSYAA